MTSRYDTPPSSVLPVCLRPVDGRARPTPDGPPVLVVDVDGVVVGCNAVVCALVDRPAAALLGSAVEQVVTSGAAEALRAASRGQASGRTCLQLAGGDARPVLSDWSVVHTADAAVHVVFTGRPVDGADVSAPRDEQLRTSSLHDGLTGLPTRTLLLDRLQHAVEHADRSTTVLVVDLDGKELVDDPRGGCTGDALVLTVAARLVDVAGPPATVARTGEDEFVVLVEDCDAACAQELAQAVFGALCVPFEVAGEPVPVDACVGVATTAASTTSATDLLRCADTAMHAARATGRSGVRTFDPAVAEDVEHRDALAADLRTALAEDALSLHYQPVVRLGSGHVVGMEALARWTHPERGAVPPASFVAVADLTGLSGALDRWVVRRALHDAGVLQAAGAVPPGSYVAVNLSAGSLADGWLDRDLPHWTAAAGLSPEQVLLEITETSIMRDTALAIGVLRSLRDQGFGVAIDDFGTGYSSLALLRDLPVTTLKVDRSFVTDLPTGTDALAIVASIVDLARAVGVSVIAEGVETPEQSDVLQRLGCADGQGWLWSTAVPAGQLLAERPWQQPLVAGTAAPQAGALARRSSRGAAVTVEHGLVRLLALHRSGASLATIAAALNVEGFRAPSGARWHRTSVARAIADDAYPMLGT